MQYLYNYNGSISTQQNSYFISRLLGTVTTQVTGSDSALTAAGSTVTTQLINCEVVMLPTVNSGGYTVTIQSLCSHCA